MIFCEGADAGTMEGMGLAIVQCSNHHYFDDKRYKECPHCKDETNYFAEGRKNLEEDKTVSLSRKEVDKLPEGKANQFIHNGDGDDNTVSLYARKDGLNPVVGWLVCLSGKEKGRDYRIHAGKNYVGRSLSMDVVILDDVGITRERHCSIVYEPNKNQFFAMVGNGASVCVNGELIREYSTLSEGDEITIGNTTFILIPFCKEGRVWEE